ncbi:hypothetical protein BDZ97DRAFT_1753592 [Flammula alnicola]|nr:hypothetical protein BDZ97DRAFT_1767413 [Flammula alnicola]KAF8970790.1 hypothetical protein BDZ97DRAFT_1753592 [Flammula alnicola]
MSNLPRLMNETKRDITDAGLVLTIVGHVGDGNFLVLILFKTDKEKAKVRELVQLMMKQATAWTGLAHEQALLQSKVWIDRAAPFSVTGKHGVGVTPFELQQLPPIFIPYVVPGNRRMPPENRRGYSITTTALLRIVKDQGYDKVPVSGSPSPIQALHIAQDALQARLQWPVKWRLMAKAMPPELEERLRKEMLAKGPPTWHLDYYKDNWDWKEHK